MATTIDILGFGALPVTPPFGPSSEIFRRANGRVQSVRDVWRFSGLLPADGTGITGLKFKRDLLLSAFQIGVAKIQFKDGATVIEEIGQPRHPRGANFRNFSVRITGGEWVNLLAYDFEVFGERAVAFAGIFETTTRETTTSEEGGTRFVLDVDARGPGALEFVRGKIPTGATRTIITQTFEDDLVRGSFEVAQSAETTLSIEETVEVTPGVFPVTHRLPTRSARPLSFYSSRVPTRIRITGSLEATVGKAIVPPVSKTLAKFVVEGGIRISRSVRGRAGSTTKEATEKYSYEMNFEVPFEVSIESVLKERRAFSLDSFIKEERAGSTFGFEGANVPGGVGLIDPGAGA